MSQTIFTNVSDGLPGVRGVSSPGDTHVLLHHPVDIPENLADVQGFSDTRQISIQDVGISSVTYPLNVLRQDGSVLSTVAVFQMTVFLPAEQKGTHMSRFVELLENQSQKVMSHTTDFENMLHDMVQRLDAQSGRIQIVFPYFMAKKAPVSGITSLMDYKVTLEGKIEGAQTQLWLKVVVPVTSLCPCSKKISEYGAHNQRSHITVYVELKNDLPVESLILTIEKQASCELWGLLKRSDEKYVTEHAYENPKFVEDLVRDVAVALNDLPEVGDYTVEVENFESIHNHSAFARISKGRVSPWS